MILDDHEIKDAWTGPLPDSLLALIQAGNPETVYLKKMEAAAMTEGQSRLGLIRILYEANAKLRLEVVDTEVRALVHGEILEQVRNVGRPFALSFQQCDGELLLRANCHVLRWRRLGTNW